MGRVPAFAPPLRLVLLPVSVPAVVVLFPPRPSPAYLPLPPNISCLPQCYWRWVLFLTTCLNLRGILTQFFFLTFDPRRAMMGLWVQGCSNLSNKDIYISRWTIRTLWINLHPSLFHSKSSHAFSTPFYHWSGPTTSLPQAIFDGVCSNPSVSSAMHGNTLSRTPLFCGV
jgi:hypothetical protein